MPQREGWNRDVPGRSPGPALRARAPVPGKRTLTEQVADQPDTTPVQRKPADDAPAASSEAPSNARDQLAHLLAEPCPSGRLSLRPDPVVAYLETLDTRRQLDELSDAIECGYGLQLEVRCSSSPRLMAAVDVAELARIAPITPAHPALQRAG